MNAAGFNRRMRKTACPVVWEGGRAKSRSLHPIEKVLDYLGRYTHRVAISNNRLKELKDGQVSFAYKDYKHEHRQKVMTFSAEEFLRRFLLHVLPNSFQRIRHYGLLSNRHRGENLARCRELLGTPAPVPEPRRHYRDRIQQLGGHDP